MAVNFADCVFPLGNFTLTDEVFNCVFDKNLDIKKNENAEALCQYLSTLYNCPFKSHGCSNGRKLASFRIACIVDTNQKYVIKYYKKFDAEAKHNKTIEIYTNRIVQCENHKDRPEGRNIKGNERKLIKQELLVKTPLEVRNLKSLLIFSIKHAVVSQKKIA